MKMKFVALMMIAGSATAGDVWVDMNGVSKHIGAEEYTFNGETKKFNEINRGLGVGVEVHKNVEVTAGFYENSYYKNTVYVGSRLFLNYKVGEVKIKPGVLIGAVTGYDDTVEQAKKLQPIGYATLSVEYENVRVGFGYLPSRAVGGNADVFMVQLGFKL